MLFVLAKVLVPFLVIFNLSPLIVWAERKGCAYIQDRMGPNRASLFGLRLGGLLHPLADIIKFMNKEDITPHHVNKLFYFMAPFLAVALACVTYVVIPFAHPITVNGELFTFQAADINVGILYVLAMGSLSVFAVMLAGWSSNNKYALLGGLRSSAQMISYEISLGLSLMSVVIMTGSLQLNDMIVYQSEMPWGWNVIRQPLACLLFIVAMFAETNRSPFDLPEGESEIVAGYHVEYSSMKFSMFYMAEYVHIAVASALIAILFFGGWQVPFASTEFLRGNANEILFILLFVHAVAFLGLGAFFLKKFERGKYGDKRDFEVLVLGLPLTLLGLALAIFTFTSGGFQLADLGRQLVAAFVQFGFFMIKVLFFCWTFIWVRWTLPRFRYDQLMTLGWKIMLPLSLANLAVTGVVLLFV